MNSTEQRTKPTYSSTAFSQKIVEFFTPTNQSQKLSKNIRELSIFMAETNSSSPATIYSGSSITHMPEDHLFSIFLLLPIDSILSFAMTCKRFRSLNYSDALWESICRRDWGHSSVDALKSSIEAKYHHQQPPWMKLYKQVSQLDTASCHRLSDPDGDMLFPSPRASHSLNFVSDCLVLFGGGCEGGQLVFFDNTHFGFG